MIFYVCIAPSLHPEIQIILKNTRAMQTKELEPMQDTLQKVKLVDGVFTPSEAADIVGSLIDEKINFHKIQRLQRWEGDHKCDTGDLNDRITELEQDRAQALEYIAQIRKEGKSIRINGILEISVEESGE